MTSGGALNTRQTYFPYGAKRVFDGSALPTDYTFTGQKSDDSTGLMFYNARYYDATLGRFTQADTIVPNPSDPQSLNRYSYTRNNPANRIDPSGHADCAPEDDWCWQNRWYEAHGQCWSDRTQSFSKSCTPEFQDEGILNEVLDEIAKAANTGNPTGVLIAILDAVGSGKMPLPNMLILGIGVSGNFYAAYGAIAPQWVFDYKHNQIQQFVSPAVGGGISGIGFSFGPQFGIGWCNAQCNSVADFTGAFAGKGASLIALAGLGGGIEQEDSGKYGSTNSNVIQTFTFSLLLGTPGGEGHLHESYSVPVDNTFYSFPGNDAAMYVQTYSIVYQYTNDIGLASLYASYAFLVNEQP